MRMILVLQTERLRTLDEVRAVIDGNQRVDFQIADRESAYDFIRRTLVRFHYLGLSKPDRGVIRRYLAKMTGLSRAQLTRLIRQYRDAGRIVDRRGKAPAKPFRRRYTAANIRRLAEVDATLGVMSGPATRAVMRREFEVFGDPRFERLARLSKGPVQHRAFELSALHPRLSPAIRRGQKAVSVNSAPALAGQHRRRNEGTWERRIGKGCGSADTEFAAGLGILCLLHEGVVLVRESGVTNAGLQCGRPKPFLAFHKIVSRPVAVSYEKGNWPGGHSSARPFLCLQAGR